MSRADDVKRGIRLVKKLQNKTPLTLDELRVFKARGWIKKSNKPGVRIERTKKGTKLVKTIKGLGLI